MEAAGKGSKTARRRKAKKEREAKERSTGHHPEECPVCMTVFNDTVQRPRTLPCGHTVCTLCVNKLKQQGHVVCPECRVNHAVPEGGQFPVCYAVEALIKRTEGAEAAAASPPPSAGTGKGAAAAAGQKEASGLSRKMRSFLQEQQASVAAAITACQEVQAQLDQYQTTLRGWGEQQQQLEDRLQGLLDQSRSARELVWQEESCAAAKKEEAREGEQKLHAALEALRTAAAEQEAHLAVAKGLRCTFEAKEVFDECRESFPDANTATTVRKVREASNAAVEAFQAAVEAFQAAMEAFQTNSKNHPCVPEGSSPQSEADCTVMDRLYAIVPPSLKAEDLRSPTQPVRRLLEAGRVFGVHQVEGQRRYARISLEADQVYLHTLKEGPLPSGAFTLEVSQLVPPSPPCMVFMDLSWPGSAPRRVHVRLSPDTPRGRQMVLLCTGQRGPSYAGTRLLEVKDKGQPGECVCGGDYESNDGSGGAALLPGLDEGEYRESGKAGTVCGILDNPAVGAVFYIITRDREDTKSFICVFGEVVQGLDAVVAAAQHTPITQVTVKDCGVVL